MKPVEAMNALQDVGVISDLCVKPEDVAAADVEKAIEYLKTLKL